MTILRTLCKIEAEEQRNVLGRPKKFQIVDGIGIAYGSYFIWATMNPKKAPTWLNIAIAATMIYIHSERFFYAPQTNRETV